MKRITLSLLACAAGATASAQTLSGLKLEPASARTGEPVRITATFDNADNPNCNARLYFGDGGFKDFKINQAKDVPLVATYTYNKPGNYTVMVEGKTALPTLKCTGPNQRALLAVAAPPPPPPPPTASAPEPAAPPAAVPVARSTAACPPGWAVDVKSVNKKSGAFTCKAKAGAALPTAKLDCPAPLGYFENKSKGQLGCRP